jgi:hypothetical protein
MYAETWHWMVFPIVFFGMMILCMALSRRRNGGWCCGSSFADRFSHDERIRRMEEEIKRLKGRR